MKTYQYRLGWCITVIIK